MNNYANVPSRYHKYGLDDYGSAVYNPSGNNMPYNFNIYDVLGTPGVASAGDAVFDAGIDGIVDYISSGVRKTNPNVSVKGVATPKTLHKTPTGTTTKINPNSTVGGLGKLRKGTSIGGTPKNAHPIKSFWSNSVKPNFGWNLKDGAKVFGKNIGKAANIGSGIMYGVQALGNMNALNKSRDSADDLIDQILISANNNPIANSYLTSEQKSMLNKARRGDLDTETSIDDFIPDDLLGNIGDIGLGVLMGLPGGLPGMIIGGAGSAINAGLEDSMQEQQSQVAELEALLQALQDAELQYQSMKRPNFTGLGIQQRYQNMYM